MDSRPVLVTGATGYVGRRLVADLVATGRRVRCLVRTPAKLAAEPWIDRVEVVRGDVLDPASLPAAFAGVGAAYYLVHSIGAEARWGERDRQAAANVAAAAAAAGIDRIIYLGGLGDERAGALSPHLASRQEVGRVLAAGPVPVTELRAAVIIGSGSLSFEMLRHLVEVLPVMITPRWVDTRVQPIGIRDVLTYLVGVLEHPDARGRVFEIGGADVVTYRQMMDCYAELAGLRRRIILPVPVLSPRLSSAWVSLVTPIPATVARPLIDSLVNEVVVRDPSIRDVVPHEPMTCREAIGAALRRLERLEVVTRWTDADQRGRDPADPLPSDPTWAGARVYQDRQVVDVEAAPGAVFAEVCSLGGDRGWLVGERLWALRGLLDRTVGGVGMRRGRRHPTEVRVGDVVDFWRVEALETDRLLRLRAEMRLPGDAWLEWRLQPLGGGRTRLVQRAVFRPKGLLGRCYWAAVAPFHRFIFGPLARALARSARRRPTGVAERVS